VRDISGLGTGIASGGWLVVETVLLLLQLLGFNDQLLSLSKSTKGRLTVAWEPITSDDFSCLRWRAQNQQFKGVPGIVPLLSNALEKMTR
jgi:hypothetical protein